MFQKYKFHEFKIDIIFRLLVQIHDELLFEIPDELLSRAGGEILSNQVKKKFGTWILIDLLKP